MPTVGRRFPEALDRLTEIFLEAGPLIRLPASMSHFPDGVVILDLEIEKNEVSGALRSAPFFFGGNAVGTSTA